MEMGGHIIFYTRAKEKIMAVMNLISHKKIYWIKILVDYRV